MTPEKSEKEEPEMAWKECKITDFTPQEVVRTPGKKRYRVGFKEFNGDTYSNLQTEARAEGKDDEHAKQLMGDKLRRAFFVSFAGQPYDSKTWATVEREMPPWMKEDTERMLVEYVEGNL